MQPHGEDEMSEMRDKQEKEIVKGWCQNTKEGISLNKVTN
jgi:uncharacterized protein YecA (UPF0149 family)